MVAPPLRLLLVASLVPMMLIVRSAAAQPVDQPFTFSNAPHTLPHLEHGSVALGDVDGDGDLDAFVMGLLGDAPFAGLFTNHGPSESGWDFEETASSIPDLAFGEGAWGDYDRDGDIDLVIVGSRTADWPYEPATLLFRNDDGALVLTENTLEEFHSGAAEWADLDNDGDLDLIVGGQRADESRFTFVYRNGADRFEPWVVLVGVAFGDIAAGDYDADGDFDLALTGVGANGLSTVVYQNSLGSLSPVNAALRATAFSDVEWSDIDEDGDLDLLLTGGALSTDLLSAQTQLYRYENGRFTEAPLPVPDVLSGAVSPGDYDNDGDLDLLVIGSEGTFGRRLARLYAKQQDAWVEKIRTLGITFGSVEWGDLEGDGDVDIVVAGLPATNAPFVNVYQNERQVRTAFSSPDGLRAEGANGRAAFEWGSHPDAGSYNLRVGTSPGASDIVSPMANLTSGRRLLARPGNVQQNESWVVHDLPAGIYYWSVQAVDRSFFASAFAPEQVLYVATSTSSEEILDETPIEAQLHSPVPNPSSGRLSLEYSTTEAGPVSLRVYDILGRTVSVLVRSYQSPGKHRAVWEGRDSSGAPVASGLYMARLEAGSLHFTTPIVISR